MINWLHTNIPKAVLGEIAGFQIHWYGLLIAIGIIAAYLIVKYLVRKYDLKIDLDILLIYLVIGGIVGGRLYYVFYAWPFYQNNLLDIFKVWQGGMALHGDLIGGAIGLAIFSWQYKIKFFKLADIIVPAVALAQAIGRWGNYFNQELFGSPTNLPWGIPIVEILRPEAYKNSQYFHPVFLYESIVNFFIFATLFLLHKFSLKKFRLPRGFIFTLYIFLYSSLRFALEFLRQDYSPLVGNWRWFQLMSFVAVLISGIVLAAFAVKMYKKK